MKHLKKKIIKKKGGGDWLPWTPPTHTTESRVDLTHFTHHGKPAMRSPHLVLLVKGTRQSSLRTSIHWRMHCNVLQMHEVYISSPGYAQNILPLDMQIHRAY